MSGERAYSIGMMLNRSVCSKPSPLITLSFLILASLSVLSLLPGLSAHQELLRDWTILLSILDFIALLIFLIFKPLRCKLINIFFSLIFIIFLVVEGRKVFSNSRALSEHALFIKKHVKLTDSKSFSDSQVIIFDASQKPEIINQKSEFIYQLDLSEFGFYLASKSNPVNIDDSHGLDQARIKKIDFATVKENKPFNLIIFKLNAEKSRESLWANKVLLRRIGAIARHREIPTAIIFRYPMNIFSGYYSMFNWVSRLYDMERVDKLPFEKISKKNVFFFGG